MTQPSLLEIEYTKKIQAAAVNQAVTQLVAAKEGLSKTSKSLSKNKDYDAAISSLQQFGVEMSRVHYNKESPEQLDSPDCERLLKNSIW